VRTHDQLADVFSKILPSGQFHRLLNNLGSVNPLDPAREGVLKITIANTED
jgi:hypothetical protein